MLSPVQLHPVVLNGTPLSPRRWSKPSALAGLFPIEGFAPVPPDQRLGFEMAVMDQAPIRGQGRCPMGCPQPVAIGLIFWAIFPSPRRLSTFVAGPGSISPPAADSIPLIHWE